MATLVWAAIDQFGLSPQEMLELLGVTVIAVGVVIAFAASFVLLWMGIRALLRRARREPPP